MQSSSVLCDQKFSCKKNLLFFKAVSPSRLPFYLGSLLYIISSLFSHSRSWDYPENVGIYSQFDIKSKTWFSIFLNVYVSSMEQDKFLISQLSPPKTDPMKMNCDNFQIQNEVPKQLGLEKQMQKLESLVLFSYLLPELWSLNCQKLCPFNNFLLMSLKNLRSLEQFTYMNLKFSFCSFRK